MRLSEWVDSPHKGSSVTLRSGIPGSCTGVRFYRLWLAEVQHLSFTLAASTSHNNVLVTALWPFCGNSIRVRNPVVLYLSNALMCGLIRRGGCTAHTEINFVFIIMAIIQCTRKLLGLFSEHDMQMTATVETDTGSLSCLQRLLNNIGIYNNFIALPYNLK